jgi:hypothetical protein
MMRDFIRDGRLGEHAATGTATIARPLRDARRR